MSDTMIDTLTGVTKEVFETMVFRNLTIGEPSESAALRPPANVVGTVGFAGSKKGLVAFYSTLDGARNIAGAMLGMEPAEINGELADAIGEITNMIAGSFRTKMATQGQNWAISVPTVTMGSDFYITTRVNGRRVLLPFKMESDEIFVELILNDDEAA